ncbi:C-type lectin mannose-binding isoform-like [Branchiostoma floridae x Branchiostoma belcheri]
MITQKGMIPTWFVEKKSAKGAGPTVVQAYIQVDDEGEPAAGVCKAGYRLVSRTCIRLSAGTKSYDDARKACIDDGGTLAMPKTRKLDVALRNLVKTIGQNQHYWIGMKDVRSRVVDARRWGWEDGSDLGNYLAWCPGEPSNHKWQPLSKLCVQYWSGNDGYPMWDDVHCQFKIRYICQTPIT